MRISDWSSDVCSSDLGLLEVTLGSDASANSARAEPWSTYSVPGDCWRTYRSVGDKPVLMSVTTAGDGRAIIEWDAGRSEERRVGKECVSTCRYRWSPDH